ncbi:hypothetical protein H5410_027079 [Solanum commersonii]|uniref:Uncharacterized protein n=1 Tax=Solanum commersonii TaxID=4109 RepID=A0A9J5YY07_SOLCO|nr:hypothetical protein H5410_027079 [Solanum commersonii]
MKELHKIFDMFFWINKVIGKSNHWASGRQVCLPKHEGGFGSRSMFDMSQPLYAKLWWKFRTQNSIWAYFMWNKYFKKQIPSFCLMERWISIMGKHWEPRGGTSSVWFENLTNLGPLFLKPLEVQTSHNLTYISSLMNENG